MRDVVRAQPAVGPIHVAYDDGDVLKPQVIAATISRDGAPVGRCEKLAKGEALAGKLQCSLCHGANLEGIGPVPTLAGRSPSYMARQLFDFQTGARHGLWSDLMKPIAAKMTAEDLVNITAFIASKNPPAADVRQTARAN